MIEENTPAPEIMAAYGLILELDLIMEFMEEHAYGIDPRPRLQSMGYLDQNDNVTNAGLELLKSKVGSDRALDALNEYYTDRNKVVFPETVHAARLALNQLSEGDIEGYIQIVCDNSDEFKTADPEIQQEAKRALRESLGKYDESS